MDPAAERGDPALIEFEGVSKVYGAGAAAVHALSGVDLAIRAGEMVAIMGPSGSGKSTALNMIGCLDTPSGGSYRFKGVDVGRLTRGQRALLRRHFIGFVFQGFNLLSRTTAVENVELPLIYRGLGFAERRKLAMRALERVGLAERAHHAPSELSGGQQQRVAIARALAPNPSVLLLDEPTSALDPELINEVLVVIQRLAVEDGLTMIISTHQLRFADEVADRIVFLSGGAIVEEGPAHELLTQNVEPVIYGFLD